MKYRNFSDLGWNVSEIGLGCWQIGWCWGDVSDTEARDVLKEALDKGVNFFDTSDTYGDGRSEKFLSEVIKSTKEKIYVTTKLGRRIRGTNYGGVYRSIFKKFRC
jgi:aryl-alcohol dehydrogenase-like predicted oxidoreductase